MSDSNSNSNSNYLAERLKDFFQPDCSLPVEQTLEILRAQNVAIFNNSIDQGIRGFTFLLNSYKHAIEAQSQELSTLKAIETYIRRGSLTNEKLKELMEKLDAIRMENMQKLAAMQAQAKTGGG